MNAMVISEEGCLTNYELEEKIEVLLQAIPSRIIADEDEGDDEDEDDDFDDEDDDFDDDEDDDFDDDDFDDEDEDFDDEDEDEEEELDLVKVA